MAQWTKSLFLVLVGWSQKDVMPLLLSLDEIVTASNNFSEENKLGEGGFGAVYKVNIDDSCLFK